ncbi:MAG: DUF883 family protein [Rhodospirillaceae bacterium]|nr:DUF883 family protein [Rhodospirillaceae bacterium]
MATGSDVDAKLSDLRADFELMRDDLKSLGQQLTGLTKSYAAKGVDRAQQAAEEAGERLSKTAKDAMVQIDTQWKEHPVATVGVAFALGLVLGRWLRR